MQKVEYLDLEETSPPPDRETKKFQPPFSAQERIRQIDQDRKIVHVPVSVMNKFTWSISQAKLLGTSRSILPEKNVVMMDRPFKFNLFSTKEQKNNNQDPKSVMFGILFQNSSGFAQIQAQVTFQIGNKSPIEWRGHFTGDKIIIENAFSLDEILLSGGLLTPSGSLEIEVTVNFDSENFGVKGSLTLPSLRGKQNIMNMPPTFKELLDTGLFSDVTVNVGKKQYELHRTILAQSPVFQALLSSTMMESKTRIIDLDDINVDAFDNLVEFLYTGKCQAFLKVRSEQVDLRKKGTSAFPLADDLDKSPEIVGKKATNGWINPYDSDRGARARYQDPKKDRIDDLIDKLETIKTKRINKRNKIIDDVYDNWKDRKDLKETKETKEVKEVKETKETKEVKEIKETKEHREPKEIKNEIVDTKSMEKIVNLLLCADRFQVSNLIKICVQYLIIHASLEDAIDLWLLADRMETTCLELKIRCLNIIVKNRGSMLTVFQQISELPRDQADKLRREMSDRVVLLEGKKSSGSYQKYNDGFTQEKEKQRQRFTRERLGDLEQRRQNMDYVQKQCFDPFKDGEEEESIETPPSYYA